jgi:OOP family OmpA-OmpF porin
MANYVERVLYSKSKIKANVGVLDSDGDGVPDYQDKCPDTPKGAKVDKDGCWAYHGVFFDFDKATIKPEYHGLFENAVHVMNINPGLEVQIEGHTDSIGSAAYNQKLSERRAKSVKNHLVEKGVSASRMTTKGFGESDPITGNDTASGRAYNRRVEFEITHR